MNLDRLLQQPHALPAVPKVVHDLIQTFNLKFLPVFP